MAVENLKSTPITNDDAIPRVPNTAGAGGNYDGSFADGYVTISASASVGSTYRICRIPTNARVKACILESEAQGAGAVQIGVYAPNGGAVVNVNLLGNDISLASAMSPTDEVAQSGNYTMDKRSQPLWQAAGAASDPGGYYDIALTVHTTAVTTGGGKTGLRVFYA